MGTVGDVPVFPAPRRVESGRSARAVAAGGLGLVLAGGACSGDCAEIVSAAFVRVVNGAFAAQQGLARWRLSLHRERDAPAPAKPTPGLAAITALRVVFRTSKGSGADGNVLPELQATNTSAEWYEVRVGTTGAVVVRVRTAWGAVRAFETVAQLAEWDDEQGLFVVGRLPLVVEDWPRFAWRGLMVDTARHFLPLPKLKQLVDAAAAMKLNVLHLHLTDAQSFPFVVESVPELAGRGTFGPKAVHSHADMQALVAHARSRGIMVVPEIDIPAHTGSWRFADPDLVVDCWEYAQTLPKKYFVENILPLNPASPKTWATITKVLGEVSNTFPSPYLHVGGDEVRLGCWEYSVQAEDIQAWMSENGHTSLTQVEGLFDRFAQTTAAKSGKRPIVWEDAFVAGHLDASSRPIVQVWRDRSLLPAVVRAGNNAVLSAGYCACPFLSSPFFFLRSPIELSGLDLDMQSPVCGYPRPYCVFNNHSFSWTARDMFLFDPVATLGLTPEEELRVLGAEASMWGEAVDEVNVDAMALSRAVGMAERLWSNADLRDPDSFEVRTQRFRCLAVRRGTSGAGPLASDFCEVFWAFPPASPKQPLITIPHPTPVHKHVVAPRRSSYAALGWASGSFLVTFVLAVFGPLRKWLLPPTIRRATQMSKNL